jgi:MFS superfamily sulfate permease-like transporter
LLVAGGKIMPSITPSKIISEPRRHSRARQHAARTTGSAIGHTFCLAHAGALTLASCQKFENKILGALKRHQDVLLDLAEVNEIDLYGIHLLHLLQQLADRKVIIVASSAAVESAKHSVFASTAIPAQS